MSVTVTVSSLNTKHLLLSNHYTSLEYLLRLPAMQPRPHLVKT